MFIKDNVELLDLTPELATKFATMKPLPGERDIKPQRLGWLERHVKNGTFVGTDWAYAICRSTKEEHRLNGQHSSTMLVSLPPEQFPKGLFATVTTYLFDSIAEDGFVMFDMFDNPISVRKNQDVVVYYRAQYPKLGPLNSQFLQNVVNGIAKYEKDLKDRRVLSTRNRGLYFDDEKYQDFALWLHQFAGAKHGWSLSRDTVVAEILADWKYHPAMSLEFWTWILDDSHHDKDHDTHELADALLLLRSEKKASKHLVVRRKVRKAWARYCRDRQFESGGPSGQHETQLNELRPS